MAEVGGQENELNAVNFKQQSPKQQRIFSNHVIKWPPIP